VSAYDPHAWIEFAVAIAGAAAVLTGLIFVAVSINLDNVIRVRGLPGRAGESIVMFLGILIFNVFLLAPGQSTEALGVELVVTGLMYVGLLLLLAASGFRGPTRQPLAWKVTRLVAALAASIPVVVAGASLLAEAGGGLYWLMAAVVIAFAVASANAWVLLVEIVRDERYLPADDANPT
jgi:hypothetical protein